MSPLSRPKRPPSPSHPSPRAAGAKRRRLEADNAARLLVRAAASDAVAAVQLGAEDARLSPAQVAACLVRGDQDVGLEVMLWLSGSAAGVPRDDLARLAARQGLVGLVPAPCPGAPAGSAGSAIQDALVHEAARRGRAVVLDALGADLRAVPAACRRQWLAEAQALGSEAGTALLQAAWPEHRAPPPSPPG